MAFGYNIQKSCPTNCAIVQDMANKKGLYFAVQIQRETTSITPFINRCPKRRHSDTGIVRPLNEDYMAYVAEDNPHPPQAPIRRHSATGLNEPEKKQEQKYKPLKPSGDSLEQLLTMFSGYELKPFDTRPGPKNHAMKSESSDNDSSSETSVSSVDVRFVPSPRFVPGPTSDNETNLFLESSLKAGWSPFQEGPTITLSSDDDNKLNSSMVEVEWLPSQEEPIITFPSHDENDSESPIKVGLLPIGSREEPMNCLPLENEPNQAQGKLCRKRKSENQESTSPKKMKQASNL